MPNTELTANKGKAFPLGATISKNGVNFSLFAPFATKVELLLFKDASDLEPLIYELSDTKNKSFYYWHIWIPNIGKNQLYAYRVFGENNKKKGIYFDSSKILIDPYAKAIVGKNTRESAKKNGESNLNNCVKSVVIDDSDFDWKNDVAPKYELNKTVIYEMHVSGFTKNKNSRITDLGNGTYSSLIQKIPFLKDLGITTVELLPVFAFDKEDAFSGKTNYWGYSPFNFFAIHPDYGTNGNSPQETVNEFKNLIKQFHKAGIEVILDVVYNHTTENKVEDGPTYSMRGIANNSYYLLDKDGNQRNYTGTGNTINANHSVVRRMILDSLKYWVQEMHVDGFRFDLASILSRGENGDPLKNAPLLWSIESDPIFSNIKLIAEPWDASGLYQVHNFRGDKWAVWNGDYRDTIRRFLIGEKGMVKSFVQAFLGSPNQMKSTYFPFSPNRNIHFITAHDGFTLNDLFSYNQKHNFNNGENNKDGHNQNFSWNCGIEGETNDFQILELRKKLSKNALFILLLSQGTPMILMGDEMGRTQKGNNNAYCQDNEIGWQNWDLLNENKELFEFTKKMIQIKKSHKIFQLKEYLPQKKTANSNYVQFHGIELNKPDLSHHSHSIMLEFYCLESNLQYLIIFNLYWESLNFNLPKNKQFKLEVYSGTDTMKDFYSNQIKIEPRSVALLIG